MNKGLYTGLIALLALLLWACAPLIPQETTTTQATTIETNETAATDITEATTPSHSPLFLPPYTTDQIIDYFEEVVLHMEYTEGAGNASLVQKWTNPIYYRIFGNPTDQDLTVLSDLFAQLKNIQGFPGIYAAAEEQTENLSIRFLDAEAFSAVFSTFLNNEYAYGATQFWYYNATNEIHTATIGYRTDIDQATRTSILIEEVVNMLGISDTVLREDSIVYQYSNDNLALSDVDWLILKLLYSTKITCGMDAQTCKAIIQELYY